MSALRKFRNRCVSYARWRRQGRPTRHPVIIRQGQLVAMADGHGLIQHWAFDLSRMADRPEGIDIDDLWEWLSSQYPVTRPAVSS